MIYFLKFLKEIYILIYDVIQYIFFELYYIACNLIPHVYLIIIYLFFFFLNKKFDILYYKFYQITFSFYYLLLICFITPVKTLFSYQFTRKKIFMCIQSTNLTTDKYVNKFKKNFFVWFYF